MDGLISAFAISPNGKARVLSSPDDELSADEWLWAHFERDSENAREWIMHKSGLLPVLTDALLSEQTRPRYSLDDDDALLILRGVNLNEGASVHQMISLRMAASSRRIITLRRETIFALMDLREAYRTGAPAPGTPADFIEAVVSGLTRRIADTVRTLEDTLDELEERATLDSDEGLRQDLIGLRRKIIPIRRYVLPQREALIGIAENEPPWSDNEDHDHFERRADDTTRLVEALDALRERAGLLQEQIASELADTMNRNTYALSIIAAVFLPLGFLTGLLGINVGGMPGTENPAAFWIVVALCVVSAAGVVWLLRHMRLM